VLLAKPRGYCAGVERAVKTVEAALERYGPPVYVRRQIVHNSFVVRALERRGAIFVDELPDVPAGSTVIFSAHGVAPGVRDEAGELGLHAIDATCPLVTKVHNEAKRFAASDSDIILIGHRHHEEVEGTIGEAPRHIQLVETVADVEALQVRDPDRVAWLSQTTLSVSETEAVVEALRERFPRIAAPPAGDICYATQNRQLAVREIAAQVQLLIVVGSANSSNSVRLVEVALEAGVPNAYLVDDAAELDPRWFDDTLDTVGLTSGASVPERLLRQVLDALAGYGFGEIAEVEAAHEAMTFVLPQELR
jgi:4-hydroxy-3-methylbut-2-enyl diphosphate reductase